MIQDSQPHKSQGVYKSRVYDYPSLVFSSDAHLVDRYLDENNPDLIAEVFRRHHPTVVTACRRVISNYHDIDDACQTTFVVLMERVASIRSPDRIGMWLATVARRVASHIRSSRRPDVEVTAELSDPRETSPSLAIDNIDVVTEVVRELRVLPHRYQQILELYYLSGYRLDDLSEQLAVSKGTLKVRLLRGRRMLRRKLSRVDFESVV